MSIYQAIATADSLARQTKDKALINAPTGAAGEFTFAGIAGEKSKPFVTETYYKSIEVVLKDSVGLPPSIYHEVEDNPGALQDISLSSMPLVALYPAYPKTGTSITQEGLQLYDIDEGIGRTKYNQILTSVGAREINGRCLYVAVLNDTSISESFGIEFGESKFEGISNFASSTLSEIKFITGAPTGFAGMQTMGKTAREAGGILGTVGGAAVAAAGKLGEQLTKLVGAVGKAEFANILSGSKVDFPMIWTGASYAPSYSFTVRLYNPNPSSESAYNKFIVEPIARLLAFTMPIADSGSTFSFPVICRAVCPGLFQLDGAFISSIDVIKGGETNDFSFTQRPGSVDLKVTINDLYNTMVAHVGDSEAHDVNRPTFQKYIGSLKTKINLENLSWASAIEGGYAERAEGVTLGFADQSPIPKDPIPPAVRGLQDRVSPVMVSITDGIEKATTTPTSEIPKVPRGIIKTLVSTTESISGRVKTIQKTIRDETLKVSAPIRNAYADAKNTQSTVYGRITQVQNDINNLVALKSEAQEEMSRVQTEVTMQRLYLKNLRRIY